MHFAWRSLACAVKSLLSKMSVGGRDCAKETGATRTRMRMGSYARVTENASSGMDKIVDRITHGAVSRLLADATGRRHHGKRSGLGFRVRFPGLTRETPLPLADRSRLRERSRLPARNTRLVAINYCSTDDFTGKGQTSRTEPAAEPASRGLSRRCLGSEVYRAFSC